MKIYGMGPTLLAALFALVDFPLQSLSVRVGLSLSPAAYDFNQSLSPADDSGWEVIGDEAITEDPSSFSQHSLAEIKANDALKERESLASRVLKPIGILSSGEAGAIAEGGLSQLEQKMTEKTIGLGEYNSQTIPGKAEENSSLNFLQMDKIRRWWAHRREATARRREQRRLKEEAKRREQKRRRQAEREQRGAQSGSDSDSSEGEFNWTGSGSDSLLGNETEEESLDSSSGPYP